ncbi:hypothetical protein AVEN_232262-1, partial [Araneus ventricosus]
VSLARNPLSVPQPRTSGGIHFYQRSPTRTDTQPKIMPTQNCVLLRVIKYSVERAADVAGFVRLITADSDYARQWLLGVVSPSELTSSFLHSPIAPVEACDILWICSVMLTSSL